jgi:TRAP-type C4-dicarboxylate transport system permease small subunit
MRGGGDRSGAAGALAAAALWGERRLEDLVALLVFGLMAITAVDVAGRYLLNAPLRGGYELIELGMGLAVFAALPGLTARDGHVAMDLVDQVSRGLFDRVRRTAVRLVSAVAVGAIAWRLWEVGVRSAEYGDTTLLLRLPVAPFAFVMAGLAAATAVLVLLTLTRPHGRPEDRVRADA